MNSEEASKQPVSEYEMIINISEARRKPRGEWMRTIVILIIVIIVIAVLAYLFLSRRGRRM